MNNGPDLHLKTDLQGAVSEALQLRRPLLTHLNADTSWVLSLLYPEGSSRPAGRYLYNVLIDPWLQGPQSDLAAWFSQQWHVVDSSVQTIADLTSCLRDAESFAGRSRPVSSEQSDAFPGPKLGNQSLSYIDVVVISHEFTDHCNFETLKQIQPETPVFATKKAMQLILSWRLFDKVHPISCLSNSNHDWRNNTSSDDLPPWLGIARITTNRDALYFHSAILITFRMEPESEEQRIEGIVYTPHGINADNLKVLKQASPPISVLALLHGLHDIRLSVKRLNLGAHNALRAQRISGSKYWVSTHDEIKRAAGFVNRFLKRKVWTIEDVLKEEKREKGRIELDSPLADLRDVHFANLGSGESLLLV
ncbi:MAG: hypothetical protein LQ352_002625 [Teloschistes flavicans]|nr:MAG: hypothetical protein LQ352_002625 [Teloschistes flavicans]